MENKLDSLSYALGVNIANSLKSNGIDSVNSASFAKALDDVLKGKKQDLDDKAAADIVNKHITEANAKKQEKMQSGGKDFLAKNAKKEGVVVTASGLQYKVIKLGEGLKPVDGQQVTVHYRGSLTDGSIFDESYKRGEPNTFGVNQVIAGWTEGLKLMPVGSTFEFYIPSNLGYGAQGAGASIPPHAALIFTVELLAIVQ